MTRNIVLIMLCAACTGGSETGNPASPESLGLSVGVRSSDPARITSGGVADTVIDEAWVSFGELKFVSESECDDSLGIDGEVAPLLVADLAAPNLRIDIDVDSQSYCGVVVPLQPAEGPLPSGAPRSLTDRSIALRGHRSDGTRFELSASGDDLVLQFQPDPYRAGLDPLILVFDVARWMQGVDLGSATIDDDGIIRVNDDSNTELLDIFEENAECSLELYADSDADGSLSDRDPLMAFCAHHQEGNFEDGDHSEEP